MFTNSFEVLNQQGSCPLIVIDLDDVIGTTIRSGFHCELLENIRSMLSVMMILIFSYAGITVIGRA